MDPHDARPERAARYWASRPGNHHVFHVFDYQDALQEARLGLLANPSATWAILYRRVIDAARRVIPGYRQRSVPEHYSLDDVDGLASVQPGPDDILLTQERVRLIGGLPDDQRSIALAWIDGQTDTAACTAHGVSAWVWGQRRKQLFDQLRGF